MTSVAGELVVPNLQYTVRILAVERARTRRATTALVPNAYPTDLTKTFISTLSGTAGAMPVLTVKVVNASGVAQANAAVTVSGGPELEHPAHRHDERERSRGLQRPEQLVARLHDRRDARRADRHRDRRRHDDDDEDGDHPMMRDERGFTLPELLVTLVLMGIVIGAFGQMLISTSKTSNRVEEQAALQGEVRASLDRLTTDFRQATTMSGTSAGRGCERDEPHVRLARPRRRRSTSAASRTSS